MFRETNIQGRPNAKVSCCQLNWNSPCPGDRAGRQWKPAVIKADRVSGKRRNSSAMSLTKMLAWQWEKYKLSISQTNATQIGTQTPTNEAKWDALAKLNMTSNTLSCNFVLTFLRHCYIWRHRCACQTVHLIIYNLICSGKSTLWTTYFYSLIRIVHL